MNYSAIWFCRKIQKFEGLAIGGIIDTNDLEKSGSVKLQTIKFSEDHVEIHKGYAPGSVQWLLLKVTFDISWNIFYNSSTRRRSMPILFWLRYCFSETSKTVRV